VTGDWIGSIAATLTTLSFVPQAMRIVRTRHAHSISLPMYLAFTVGVGFWLAYGCILGSWPMIVSNAITFLLAAMILALKLRYG
jgi:MtN3 and saliva related transmembrane protein